MDGARMPLDDWAALAERVGAPPFAHPGWVLAWRDAFGGGSLATLTVRRDGELVALVPYMESATATLSPTNWHTPSFALLAADDAARAELARLLVAHARHRLDMSFLMRGSGDVEALLDAARGAGQRTCVRPIQRSPFVGLEGRGWEEYGRDVPGSKRLRELRRRRRKLAEQGAVTVEFVRPEVGETSSLLSEGLAVEGSGWKVEQGTAVLSQRSTRRFYGDVARWAAARGWLTLAFLRLDGRVIAFDLCLEDGRRAYVLKGGFDTSFRAFAPRTLLLADSLERAFSLGFSSYEFLGRDEEYKLAWSTGVRESWRVQAFPRSLTGLVGYAAWRYGRPAAKRALDLRSRLAAARSAAP